MEEKISNRAKVLERLVETRRGEKVSTKPEVSIVIPAYNVADKITSTLDSVFDQTFRNFEVIIVNDGSTDTEALEAQLETYSDKIIYGRQENSGASKARNAAICLSSGDLIAFLDADDFWFPDYLEKQVNFLEKNELDMVYCNAELFGDNFLAGKTYMETTPSAGDVNPISLLSAACNVITSGTLVRKKALENVHLFDPDLLRAQDFDLWFRLSKHDAKIDYQREVLIKYRVSSDSLSGSNVQRAERNITILNSVQEKYELTHEELKVWENQLAFSEAEVELEKGKLNLINGNYDEARDQIAKANEYYRTPKLFLLKMLLTVSPSLALKIFKTFRSNEFSFISDGKE